MPRRINAPLPGLWSSVDLRPWSGSQLCARSQEDAPTMTADSFGEGEGIYLDPVHMLTGYGSTTTLSERLTEVWQNTLGNTGTITLSIDATDRIRITYAGGGISLGIYPLNSNNQFGMDQNGFLIPAPGGTRLCAGEWRRGVTDPDDTIILTDGVEAAVSVGRVQDLRIALRKRSAIEDLDTTGVWCLEEEDDTVRWGLTGDGRCWWATSDSSLLEGMIWQSATFRDRLGFSGTESITTWGSGANEVQGQVADRPMPGVLHPSRPLRRQLPRMEVIGSERRLVDGRYSGVHIGSYPGWMIEGWVDGPLDLGVDLHRTWLDFLGTYARPGMPVTLVQDVGESRRALRPEGVSEDQDAYDSLYTSEESGYRGRILCRVHPDTGRTIEIEQEGLYRRRFPFSMTLDEREGGV